MLFSKVGAYYIAVAVATNCGVNARALTHSIDDEQGIEAINQNLPDDIIIRKGHPLVPEASEEKRSAEEHFRPNWDNHPDWRDGAHQKDGSGRHGHFGWLKGQHSEDPLSEPVGPATSMNPDPVINGRAVRTTQRTTTTTRKAAAITTKTTAKTTTKTTTRTTTRTTTKPTTQTTVRTTTTTTRTTTQTTTQTTTASATATGGLTVDQAGALKIQNDARVAKGLTPLAWDATLTANAQVWANHLADINQMVHSANSDRPGQGENLAWAWSTQPILYPMTQGAQGWMDEVSDYHGEVIPQGNFSDYGHYTQCMWSTTTSVGIAFAQAADRGIYTVARYSPPGNYVGQKPF